MIVNQFCEEIFCDNGWNLIGIDFYFNENEWHDRIGYKTRNKCRAFIVMKFFKAFLCDKALVKPQ